MSTSTGTKNISDDISVCVYFLVVHFILCFCLCQALPSCQTNTVPSFSWHTPSALCLQQTVRSFTQQAHEHPQTLIYYNYSQGSVYWLAIIWTLHHGLCNGLILSDGQWAIVCTSKSYGRQHNHHLQAAGSDAVANGLFLRQYP